MNKDLYYVYCKGILGVKTNQTKFRWIYGSVAPQTSLEEYENCAVKLDLCIKPEKQLGDVVDCDKRFQSYMWNSKTKTIYCRRTLFHYFKIGFNIRIADNTVFAEVGCNYSRFVQNRVMNLHGIYYLLADIINVVLLKNGFLSLYASAVYSKIYNRCTVCFAPPNTGKTLTATKLCESAKYELVGEDIVITDTRKVYSCPWTLSYRKSSSAMDDAGSLSRKNMVTVSNLCQSCELTDIVVLSLGKGSIIKEKSEVFHKISILNGYLFGYYATPIVKILAYFDEEYRNDWDNFAKSMLKEMTENCNCCLILAETPESFYEIVDFETNRK